MIERYLHRNILGDLKRKMVFIGGPRQCGKTTCAKELMRVYPYKEGRNGAYFNWDDDEDRLRIIDKLWGDSTEIVIFDELHKFRRWKSWIKGVYDTSEPKYKFLVTGSARLDVYRRGGDSLMGRYHYWRLHPFTLSEIPHGIRSHEALKRLTTVGGFPEPFLDGNEREARRWRKERFERIIKDDIRDLEPVRSIQDMSLFADLLRTRVGGLVVLNNLATELQVSPKTLKNWLDIFERMYLVFRVRPFTKNISRAVMKPPKVYFFDNSDVIGDEGARFENLVATTLLKRIHYLEDYEGFRYELCFVRDKEGREVDFAIVKEGRIVELIEVKYSKTEISKPLQYYSERLQPEKAIQIVATLKRPYSKGKLVVEGPLESLTR
ncbi:MAG: ATP-binding protein, partial [Planctomycetes bacterium]|nr:ATP-binding protein [Planctomycetota bacterium]